MTDVFGPEFDSLQLHFFLKRTYFIGAFLFSIKLFIQESFDQLFPLYF